MGRPCGHVDRGEFLASFTLSGLSCLDKRPFGPGGNPRQQVNIKALAARPDIRQAEAELKRAFYATGEARAALYPSLTLTGNVGWTNDAGEEVSPAGLLTRALASLTAPVLAKGQLRSALRKAQAEQEEAKIKFCQAVLDAGKEVNDILSAQHHARQAIRLHTRQIEKLASVLTAKEHRMRYDSDVSYLQVLLARRSLLDARLSLLSDHYALIESHIALFRALGGGPSFAS